MKNTKILNTKNNQQNDILRDAFFDMYADEVWLDLTTPFSSEPIFTHTVSFLRSETETETVNFDAVGETLNNK